MGLSDSSATLGMTSFSRFQDERNGDGYPLLFPHNLDKAMDNDQLNVRYFQI